MPAPPTGLVLGASLPKGDRGLWGMSVTAQPRASVTSRWDPQAVPSSRVCHGQCHAGCEG